MTRATRRPYACAWCGREMTDSETGRRRKYCRQSCRQRAYEQRNAVAGTSLAADSVILSAQEAQDMLDRLFMLRCAAEDLATAITEGADRDELSGLSDELLVLARDAERMR